MIIALLIELFSFVWTHFTKKFPGYCTCITYIIKCVIVCVESCYMDVLCVCMCVSVALACDEFTS